MSRINSRKKSIKTLTVSPNDVAQNIKDNITANGLDFNADIADMLFMGVDDDFAKNNDAYGQTVEDVANYDDGSQLSSIDDEALEKATIALDEEFEKFIAALSKRWAAVLNTRLGSYTAIIDKGKAAE